MTFNVTTDDDGDQWIAVRLVLRGQWTKGRFVGDEDTVHEDLLCSIILPTHIHDLGSLLNSGARFVWTSDEFGYEAWINVDSIDQVREVNDQ